MGISTRSPGGIWLTDFRFGYYSIYNNTVGPNHNQPLGNQLGIPNANDTSNLELYGGMPQFNIDAPASSGANGGGNLEYGQSANSALQQTSQYQFVNNWSHLMGNHNIKFGVDYRYGKNWTVSTASNALRSGTYFFKAARTSGVDGTGNVFPGLGLATFPMGDTSTFWRTETANVNAQSRQTRFFSYVQDQWHARPKLTVNYGVRWEIYAPETITAAGAGGLLSMDTGIVGITGVGNFNSAANVQPNYKMFAPRAGISYEILPKTVLRAGYGLVFGQGWAGDSFGNDMTGSYPSQIQQNLVPSLITPSASLSYGAVFNLTQNQILTNGTTVIAAGPPGYTFPATPSDGAYVLPNGIYQNTRPSRVRLPSVNGWNVTIQRELTPTTSLQVAYVGSEAYHNMFESSPTYNANEETLAGFNTINPVTNAIYTPAERSPYYNGTAQSALGVKYGHPFGWMQRIDYAVNDATGSYNALQVVFVKRVSNGLSFTSNYTWSHGLGHESYEFGIDPKIGRGNGYYNRRHAFVFAGNYDLPFGKGKPVHASDSRLIDQIIGGFQLNATLTLDGGLPFTACYASVAADNDVANADGCNASFVNHVPGTKFGIHKGHFDPVAKTIDCLPAASDERPDPEWVGTGATSGFYLLHLNFPYHAAAIAMPTAEPGILAPYQERAAANPLQFVLRFDPARDAHLLYPLLVALGNTKATATKAALAEQLSSLNQASGSIYKDNQVYYENLLHASMSIETPDSSLNDAFSWAIASMDQLQVEAPGHNEEALTAGFFGSNGTVRPGFGWFFGRDALWTLYAEDSIGRFETTRKEIEFLLRRQSSEGKIFHGWSQTADLVDWNSFGRLQWSSHPWSGACLVWSGIYLQIP